MPKSAFSDKLTDFGQDVQTTADVVESVKASKRLARIFSDLADILPEIGNEMTITAKNAQGRNVSVDLTTDLVRERAEGLKASASVDTSELDKKAKLFKSLIENEMLEGDEADKARELLEKYDVLKSVKTRTPRAEGETGPKGKIDFEFPINAKCADGWTWHEGGRGSEGSRWNSMRHFTRLHLEKVNPDIELKGNEAWLSEWKDAKAAFEAGADNADIPSFGVTLSKVA